MGLFSSLLAIAMFICFLACIMFVVFGQVTVRKLRKKPETKDALGTEFASGWDILNVAGALSTPRFLNKKMESSPLAFLRADSALLYKHTSRLDRILGRIFFILYSTSGFMFIGLMILDLLGFFD
ncbi:hypothetical protein [Endozoicomonas numazuensis]|uniref:Uncharacterized protein n=1 Tax=Endozoicomonas numazuensis TaxID=1137799 RepID=A0A081NHI1_9GAMM|nr:hypothetical protein [Endozoicomonas numazuensis]KEQ17904.1 hypothetical protein GZ78_09720 [Endozoicomonas numazuensis]